MFMQLDQCVLSLVSMITVFFSTCVSGTTGVFTFAVLGSYFGTCICHLDVPKHLFLIVQQMKMFHLQLIQVLREDTV